VIYRSEPAFQIVPMADVAEMPLALDRDTLYRATAVGASKDGYTSLDHDVVLYSK